MGNIFSVVTPILPVARIYVLFMYNLLVLNYNKYHAKIYHYINYFYIIQKALFAQVRQMRQILTAE